MYLHSPVLEVGSWWRVDTASGTNTPTTVYAHDGADAIPTALGASGSTVRGNTRDGTGLFWSTAATLYCKELTYQGVPTGTVVTSTGVTPTTPSGAPVDIATISTLVAALPTTYVQLLVTDATSTTLTGTLTAGHLSPVDCTAGAGARTLPAASSVAAGTPTVAKKADTSANALVVSRAGSDLIFGTGAGSTSKTLTLSGEAVTFVSNGVDRWSIESSDTPSGAIAATYAPIAATPVASSATSGTLTASAEHNLTPSSAATWTLPTSVTATKLPTTVKNNGTAAVTVARGGSDTINGGTASVSIAATEWARFTSDGAGAWTQSGTAGQSGTYAQTFKPEKYGALGDGTTNDSAAVIAAIAAAYAAGGGTVEFGPNTYRIDSQLAIPNDSHSTAPRQPPIRLIGAGSTADGSWQTQGTIPGATILDLRSTTGPAKIDTRGAGKLTIERMVLTQLQGASDTNPFIQTTNTTIHVRDVAFFGHSTLSGATCVQDAIVFGGTTTTIGGGSTAPFQGYGSAVDLCYFARIRRGAYLQAYANSIRIVGNTWSKTCGATSSEAAVHLVGTSAPGQSGSGNVITGNTFETTNYVYVVRFTDANKNYAVGNSFWDSASGTLACFYIEGASASNVKNNRCGSTFPGITAAKHLVSAVSGAPYFLERDSDGAIVGSGVTFADLSGNALLEVKQTGEIATGSTGSSAAFLSVQNGSPKVNIDAQSVIQAHSGTNLDLYAGSSGDVVRIRRGVLQLDTGAKHSNGLTWTTGTASPESVTTAPVGSLFSRSDGGATTSLYIKESGAGNTGWRGTQSVAATGTATLSGGTVTVSDASITANSIIRLASKTLGGTPGAVYVSAKTASTSFVITSTSGTDTSVIQYYIDQY